jgi:hypothetical protein
MMEIFVGSIKQGGVSGIATKKWDCDEEVEYQQYENRRATF